MKITTALLSLAFVTLSFAQTPNTWCNTDKSFCAQSLFNSTSGAITFAVSGTAPGWLGLGIGSSMSDSDVWVGWNNAGQTVISDRTATGHSMPAADANTQLLPLSATAAQVTTFVIPSNHVTKLYFARYATPKGTGGKTIPTNTKTSFIWAFAAAPPTTPADPNSAFKIHDSKGAFSFDFTAAGTAAGSGGSGTGGTGASGTPGTQTGGSSTTKVSVLATLCVGIMAFLAL
ncbi:hypothetical protein HK098_004382 [Nowakowskiella sp. JEL0407]|nr:hypothetical protein HK098_004382 [Nowakowskiella sp. JEL0407]